MMQLNRQILKIIYRSVFKRTSLFGNGVYGVVRSLSTQTGNESYNKTKNDSYNKTNNNNKEKEGKKREEKDNRGDKEKEREKENKEREEKYNKSNEDSTESKGLVRRIYNLARTGQTDIELWRDCTVRTIDQMDRLDLKGVCSILHSYGYMKYRDRNMLEMISAKLIENIRVINCSQIESVLRAYSILKFRSDFLFRLMIPEISLRMDMMSVEQVASIFYSYSNLGYYNKNLFQSIQSFLYSNLEGIKPYELTLLLNGYCKNLKGFDDRFLTVLSFQFCKLIDSYDNKLFSLAVNSLSRLNFCNHKYLPSLIESEVHNRLKLASQPFQSKSLSLILNALSRHHDTCTPLFTFLSQTVLKRLKDFDFHSICLVLSAFSRVSLSDGKTYDKVAEYIGRNSLKLYPRAIASILYSYSKAKHLHGPLFYFSGKHLELNLSSYSCDEVGMVLRAFSVLNVRNEGLLAEISEFIIKNTPDYVPMKFEDLCLEERVTLSKESRENNDEEYRENKESEGKYNKNNKNKEKDKEREEKYNKNNNEIEGLNINLLEFVGESSKKSGNYLSNGKMHSLLWIVQAYSRFYFVNDKVLRSLSRIANELVVRMNELTPFIVARLIYSFSQLNFRHETCLEMLINEIINPRRKFKFDQKELALIHYSVSSFGIEGPSIGVYKFNRFDFQSMVEKYNNNNKEENTKENKENENKEKDNKEVKRKNNKEKEETKEEKENKEEENSNGSSDSRNILDLIRRIVEQDVPSSKPMYLELLTNPVKYEEVEDVEEEEYNNKEKEEKDKEENKEREEEKDKIKEHEDVIYIHIPRYAKELVKGYGGEHKENKYTNEIEEALNKHINYNFNID